MPIKYLIVLIAASLAIAAEQEQPTPYDLIRPTYPLTWDSAVFDRFDTTVTKKHNMVPKNRTPASYAPNALIPDTLNQAYLDAINTKMSPIRINQAGYLEKDKDRQFYYVGNATTFEVVDVNGKPFSPAFTGTLTSSGVSTSSDWTIIAGTNAASNDQKRYEVDITGQSGTIQVGHLPTDLPTKTRLRVKVGNDISSTFIISDDLYSMVRSAALKFYGINRSGNGESWFHPASHTKDGGGPIVTDGEDVRSPFNPALAGTLQGGYYDCGDHLKESQTAMFAFMVSAVLAATNPDADEDNYAYNQGETVNTDGIPDMLREAKHGADFVLRAYVRANGVIDDMALSIGNFGSDHGWWGRPENQDNLPTDNSASATDRGGPGTRTVRLGEIGANIGGEVAAGLAILGKNYATYDKPFADSCLMVAKKMYDFAKNLANGKSTYENGTKTFVNNKKAAGWSSAAYNGNNEFFDDMALAAVALLYATGEAQYLSDAAEDKTFTTTPTQEFATGAGFFNGGWFVTENKGFLKNGKNTSWANAYSYALYTFYKLILKDSATAAKYGIDETKRLGYIEDVVANMIYNVSDMSYAGSASITLPSGSIGWKNTTVRYDPTWYTMMTDQTWIYNRYQAGNIFEVLAYADVASSIEEQGLTLPIMGSPDWKAAEMHQLGIDQLNYMLGVNPWDVSFILGVGDKNDAHPHHRAANPEGKNTPGANYKYNPPTGALFGGVAPGGTNSWVPSNKSWEDYHLSETCIDAAAVLVSGCMIAAKETDHSQAPNVEVEIRHVSMDSAVVYVKQNLRGMATVVYGTSEKTMSTLAVPDSNVAGVTHEIVLRGLQNGTTYYFFVVATNALNENNVTTKYMVDSTYTPYTFTTLNSVESADIQNITVCNLTSDSAEIMWYTPNGEYESKVYWDTVPHTNASEFAWNTGSKNADVSGIPTKFHYVKIGGLKEQTLYYYAVESNGVYTNTDSTGNLLKFKTPVGWYDFSVRAYQYVFGNLDFLDMNIINNESRAFDSLTLRLYFTARPEEVEKCKLLIDLDICQAYDEAGFNKPCANKNGEDTQNEIRYLMRTALPIRLDDTYDATTGKYSFYFPVPLGSTVIKSSSRARLDFGFSQGLSNDGYISCETLRQPSTKHMDKTTNDWSWAPHTWQVDGADYDGMPSEDKDYGDIDYDIPINSYIVVYRKDEFIWGFSPSYQEMTTKKAHYDIKVTYDDPFNVSNGSYVQIDQTSSTVYVTGHAYITEGGFVTKIWANGQRVTSPTAAVYNIATGMWDLNIPVKMGIGSNKIDVTVFAGPDPNCDACTENGGCAFDNRTYYVQFTKGNATASALTIKDAATGNAITSPAEPGATNFTINLMDKDKATSSTPIYVLVINGKKKDTLQVKMVADPANPGYFTSESAIAAVATSKDKRGNNQISFFSGDTIRVIYTDPDDEEDVSSQSFFAESKYPTPQKVLAIDSDCDNVADQLQITFSNALDENYAFDSLRFYIDGMKDSVTVPITQTVLNLTEVSIPIANMGIPKTAAPTGKATIFLSSEGTTNAEPIAITDGIAPTLLSVTILENPEPRADTDVVIVAFTEPVLLASQNSWPLSISSIDQSAIKIKKVSSENNGKSWKYIITGNADGAVIPIGATAQIKSGSGIQDPAFNMLDPASPCSQGVIIVETPAPVPVELAEIRDNEGDGIPDEIFLKFAKKLRDKDMLDSFLVSWGSPAIIRSFPPSTWKHTIELSDPYEKWLDSATKVSAQDTFSIITITIPPSLAFDQGTTNGAEDGYGSVTPRLGPEGGFFDKSYSLVDKCPPIIISARKATLSSLDSLGILTSEPLDSIPAGTYYLQRKRGSSDIANFIPSYVSSSNKKWIFLYSEDAEGAVRTGDSVRLVPSSELSKLKDKASNYPGSKNPWILVQGSVAEKTKFQVTLLENITAPKKGEEYYDGEVINSDSKDFRLTVFSGGIETIIAEGNSKLIDVANGKSSDTASYKHAGPTFNIDISMPSALTIANGNREWGFDISFSVDLFDNQGHFVNRASYSFNLSDLGYDRLDANGVLSLKLEWMAKDNEAPVAESGKKVGTGPYLSKFSFKARALCLEDPEDKSATYKKGTSIKTSAEKTKTFGFRRLAIK
ncbi:MAG: glycoside hydrolase family 9 protein [Fibrobacteraceae bacterium]